MNDNINKDVSFVGPSWIGGFQHKFMYMNCQKDTYMGVLCCPLTSITPDQNFINSLVTSPSSFIYAQEVLFIDIIPTGRMIYI